MEMRLKYLNRKSLFIFPSSGSFATRATAGIGHLRVQEWHCAMLRLVERVDGDGVGEGGRGTTGGGGCA